MESISIESKELEKKIINLITLCVNNLIQTNGLINKEWFSLSEAATYAGVSYNTFIKFRHMGLKVCEIDGIKRVSRKEIDLFLENNSF